MAGVLSRAQRYTDEYKSEADSTWEVVKKEHDRAMVVCDVEDLVGLGIFVVDLWFRNVDRWHEFVSEDPNHYDKQKHETLQRLEPILVEAVQLTLEAISSVKKWGFEVDGEDEFRKLADELLACTNPFSDTGVQEQIRALGKKAVKEYRDGQLQEIKHWGA